LANNYVCQNAQEEKTMAIAKTTTKTSARKTPILRFAHPFFTTTAPEARAPVPGFGTQLLTHIQGKLLPIPAAKRTPTMTLADVIGAQGETDVTNSGSISRPLPPALPISGYREHCSVVMVSRK
jgi:hypothetical protein